MHELRLLSVVFGLGTVLLTYAAAKVTGMREVWALSSGLFVALYPKNLIASSSVTNDALMIPLCALALVFFLLSERASLQGRFGHRRIHLAAMGLVLGAATITKLNSLVVAVILLVLAAIPALVGLRRASAGSREARGSFLDVGLAVIGFFAVSGWWFVRNHHLYGQFLGTNASELYLRHSLLIPAPWSQHLVFGVFPSTVLDFSWYTQPNFFLPLRMNQALAVLAVPCLLIGAWAMVWRRRWVSHTLIPLSAVSFLTCIVDGFVAVLIIIKDTSIGDMRDALFALSAFAIVITVGSARIFSRVSPRLELVGVSVWPVVLLALDLYVFVRFLIPLGGL